MNKQLAELKEAAETVLTDTTGLDSTAIAALNAIGPTCEEVYLDWQTGKIQQIGKPGVPAAAGVDINYVASRIAQKLKIGVLEAMRFIDDVLFSAREMREGR